MSDEHDDAWVRELREEYNRPAETPRDEMWSAIAPRLGPRQATTISLDEVRARRPAPSQRLVGWAVAAAAFVVLGIGIGRATAPEVGNPVDPAVPLTAGDERPANAAAVRVAALRHLQRTEGLLTMVRADGRNGRVDREVGTWAGTLLAQTRLLLDHAEALDPAMRTLLEDLELVLIQVVGTSGLDDTDPERASAEMSLALDAIEQRDVVPRIQALETGRPGLAGA